MCAIGRNSNPSVASGTSSTTTGLPNTGFGRIAGKARTGAVGASASGALLTGEPQQRYAGGGGRQSNSNTFLQ